VNEAAIWHDVECGAYADDLPLWEELADADAAPVLDLGCGTGRVALHLARRGTSVDAVDVENVLVSELRRRAAAEGLSIGTYVQDVRELALERREFTLAIAAMQLIQLLDDSAQRRRALERIAAHLAPGGTIAIAIVEDVPAGEASGASQPLPDVRELDGWLYSSLPLEVATPNGSIDVRRLRQTVSPSGELSEQTHEIRLAAVDAGTLEGEARAVGLSPVGRHAIGESEAHVGSTVVLLEREA
jgi:SAM-dependent methyltransferase